MKLIFNDETEFKKWLFCALQEAIKDWQPSNADYVAFTAEVIKKLDHWGKQMEALTEQLKKHGLQVKLDEFEEEG